MLCAARALSAGAGVVPAQLMRAPQDVY